MRKRKTRISAKVKGILNSNIRMQRRETIFKMMLKKHGKVECLVCGHDVKEQDASLEHIKPVSKGGTDDYSNLSISHSICNELRGNDDLDSFNFSEKANELRLFYSKKVENYRNIIIGHNKSSVRKKTDKIRLMHQRMKECAVKMHDLERLLTVP